MGHNLFIMGFAKQTFNYVSFAINPFNYSFMRIILSILTYFDWLSQHYFNCRDYANSSEIGGFYLTVPRLSY
jgi:hypothetical protein